MDILENDEHEVDFEALSEGPRATPINSTSTLISYSIKYYFGPHTSPHNVIISSVINIYDNRVYDDGKNYRNQIFIVKNGSRDSVPDAYQSPKGEIRIFAFENEIPAILSILNNSEIIWMVTKDGRVSFIQSKKVIGSKHS